MGEMCFEQGYGAVLENGGIFDRAPGGAVLSLTAASIFTYECRARVVWNGVSGSSGTGTHDPADCT